MKSYKKIVVTLLVALFGMGMAQAQFRFGVKAGVNLNSINFKDAAANLNHDNNCGYTVGIMGEFTVPIIGLGFDLSAMYTRMNSDPVLNNQEAELSKNFLEIPLNLKYKFSLPVVGSFLAPYLYTGPTFAFQIGKHTWNDIQSKTCQTAWNVGVGVELFHHLQVQGSYGFGMNKAFKYIPVNTGVNPVVIKANNNYWTITAAWLF
ncbi:MAG: porin family protein [Muribaculaceae bacterium]|nr:porin family protein [Muribaculaceae bacterium]MDE6754611.1 porin family protein [Muribaculaceae bacterium]